MKQETDVVFHVKEYVSVIQQLKERIAELERGQMKSNATTNFPTSDSQLQEKLIRVESEKFQAFKFIEELYKRLDANNMITPDIVNNYKMIFSRSPPKIKKESPRKIWRMKETTQPENVPNNLPAVNQEQPTVNNIIQQSAKFASSPSGKRV